MSNRHFPKRATRLAILAAAVTFAACGEETTTTTEPPAPTPPETAQSTPSPEETPSSEPTPDEPSTDSFREHFDRAAKNQLRSQGLNESEVDCALEQLREELSDHELKAALDAQQVEELQQVAADATADCRGA